MRYALANGQRQEARPSLSGKCPICDRPMVARCGQIKIWHWAHLGMRICDPWWENETEWHRAWKGQFPVDWQEVVLQAQSGEKHIADVKTDQGWVLEFQHSYLDSEERQARDAFYPKLVWVVDGARRKRDKSQFFKALEQGTPVGPKLPMLSVFLDECALLREWAGSRAPVFFDFGEGNKPEDSVLWCLLRGTPNGKAYIAKFSRAGFIDLHRARAAQMGQDFAELLKKLNEIASGDISRRRAQTLDQLARQPHYGRSRQPQSFQQYLEQRARSRRRF
jgi:competence protein CoiA